LCVYSLIADHFGDKWNQWVPPVETSPPPPYPPWLLAPVPPSTTPTLTEEEVAELRKLLERAREYDRRNSEPECETEEKRERLRKLALELGVKIDFLE
jgi:hypothetical protein